MKQTDRDILLNRAHETLIFLNSDPDEEACIRFMKEKDITIIGKHSPRQKLIHWAAANLRKIINQDKNTFRD